MERFGENFRSGREFVSCPLCLSHKDSQSASFSQCKIINEEIDIQGRYDDLFEDIKSNTNLINTIMKINELRKSKLNLK